MWVGYEAVILSGVTIGDGAIIGARALVTQDVPPYTIVGGVPARPIRQRFPHETIAALQALGWWDWPVETIRQHLPAIQQGRLSDLPPSLKQQDPFPWPGEWVLLKLLGALTPDSSVCS